MKVLCKGHVDLVDHMGSDLTVCNGARVSFSKDTEWEIDEEAVARLKESGSSYHEEDVRKLGERDQKLIRYLVQTPTPPFNTRRLLCESRHQCPFAPRCSNTNRDLWRTRSVVDMSRLNLSSTTHHGEVNPQMAQNKEVVILSGFIPKRKKTTTTLFVLLFTHITNFFVIMLHQSKQDSFYHKECILVVLDGITCCIRSVLQAENLTLTHSGK